MIKLTALTHVRIWLVLAIYVLLAFALPLHAATIYVDSGCSLDDALDAANGDEEEDDCEVGDGADTIVLTSKIEVWKELEDITSPITLEGNNQKLRMMIDDSTFDIEGGQLTIQNLTVEYARTRRSEVIEVDDGRLTIINSRFKNCREGVEQEQGRTTITGNSNICDLPVDEYVTGGGTATLDLNLPPPVSSCDSLAGGVTVRAALGSASGVECTQLDGGGVGNQSVIDMGFINAVDVWAYVEQGVEICFPQQGRIVFLDAATSPRSLAQVESYRSGTMTCAHLWRPGTVALVQGQTTEDRTPTTTTSTTTTAATTQPAVAGCPIQTTGNLRLRAAPSLQAETLGYVPRGAALGYSERTTFWFKVRYQGMTGWIGWKYVAVLGDCS